ncbi:MAG: endolytic transglycosylase MltG [Pseudomonadota bacterium]|nr:endolytic transglycosylase MltG [Pseudomonadota bacterium]
MNNFKFISISLIFFAVFSLILVHFKVSKESLVVDIPEGSSISLISNILFEEGLILSPVLFKTYTRLTLSDNKLQAGEYFFDSPQSVYTLNKKLLEGDFYYRKLTLLPGSTLKTILNLANSTGLVNDLENTEIILEEGIFFPDTYYYLKGETFSSILFQSHMRWKEISNELWESRNDDLPYANIMEATTLASIIEKEGIEKETIAGVFVNRLKLNMKLQSDPTVIYALGDNFDGDIKRKDLSIDSPYNTYRYKGLPPGPISIVSEDSLRAALRPKETDYLYFVSMGNGFHKFSKTLTDHNKAVLEYQINER